MVPGAIGLEAMIWYERIIDWDGYSTRLEPQAGLWKDRGWNYFALSEVSWE